MPVAAPGPLSCLVITPIPTVPADQGNAVNIARLNRCIRAAGYRVHMVYSAMEGMAAWQIAAMRADCDALDVLPHRVTIPPPDRRGYPLDSWYDEAVSDHVADLCTKQAFDVAVVHYVWMSRACLAIPAPTRRLLFTHDRFGDRHALLAAAGIAPTWYSVPVEEEARGLDRSDAILAVQEEEAEHFRRVASRPVHVIGSLQALRRRPSRAPRRDDRLTVGYLGSANPGNVRSLEAMIAALEAGPGDPGKAIEFVLAGPISRDPRFARDWVTRLGFVDRPEQLYGMVDLIANPSEGGSGLKIKTVECLAAGMPLVATTDAMAGLPALHPAHGCATAGEVAAWLPRLRDATVLRALEAASRSAAELYCGAQVAGFRAFFPPAGELG